MHDGVHRGMQMNVEGKPMRDQWVVRIETDAAVGNASGSCEAPEA